MHCTSCAFNIDGEFEDIIGVKRSSTSYAKQTTEVEYDENLVNVTQLQEIVAKLGYSSKQIK